MLQVVNADLRGFAKTDRAKMTCNFQSALVGLFYCCAQFGARDVHVGLKRGGAFIRPEVHHATRVVGPSKLVHHGREGAASFQIWSRDVHLGPDPAATVNQPFDFEVGERRHAAGGANRGDAERQIEAWKAVPHVRVHRRGSAFGKEHVVVHAYQARQNSVASEIEGLDVRRQSRSGGWADRLDFAVADHYGLVVPWYGAGSINHAHMDQCNHRCFYADELLTLRRGRLRERAYGDTKQQ